MGEAVVSIVVGRLTDLLTEESQLLREVTDQIQLVVNELTRMNTFLPDADSRIDEYEVRILVAEVRELAYDAEHVVETFLLKRKVSTKKFSREIKDMQQAMSLLFDRFSDCNIKSTLESPSSSSGTTKILKRFHSYATPEPEFFVGFDPDVDLLVKHLVNESTDDCYKLVSICGMGGLGKTTLARKIYNHPTIKTYFSLSGVSGLAWVSISKKWQTKQVLQRILKCLMPEKGNEIFTWDDNKLVEELLEIQQRKKCLVVLDDIWSTDAWDSLKSAFPAGKSRSRLMLTSRNDKVPEHANPNGYIHRPELLSADQSWELLRLKALPKGGDCLDITRDVKKMEEYGRKLVGYCGGLPLAIMTLGGILVTKPSLIEWEKVYNDSLLSLKRGKGFEDPNYQSQIFHLLLWSYNDLPPQLKPCFLYLGKYGEDESIDAETLYQLWIAEGMVLSSDKKEGETMMQVAESYLGELVHKSMVQVKFNDVKSSINFESCSLHDLMRDLSISQAKVEGFFKVIDLREDHLSPLVDFNRQLVVHFDDGYRSERSYPYFGKKANQQRYRSMLLFNKTGPRILPPALGSRISNFRGLRVLSLEVGISLNTSWSLSRIKLGRVLGTLVYLRYLRISDAHLMIFPSIQKLMLLETLRLDRQFDIRFPPWLSRNILSTLGRLRHLYLPSRVKNIRKNSKLRFSGLNKLETLENFDTNWCEVKDLPKLISLQKLTLQVSCYDMEEVMENLATIALPSSSCLRYLELSISTREHGLCNSNYMPENFKRGKIPADFAQVLEQMAQLPEQQLLDMLRPLFWNYNFNLQELTLSGGLPELARIFEQRPQQFVNTHFNVSQTRITSLVLYESHLVEDPMPVLEKIVTLHDLYLHVYTFMGKEMICSATGFPNLTSLTLELLPNLENWRVEEGSMPVLSNLTITLCHKLEELPEGLVFLNSLQTLRLASMPLEFLDQLRMANGEQGPQFYKVKHIPSLQLVYPNLYETVRFDLYLGYAQFLERHREKKWEKFIEKKMMNS